MYKGDQFPDKYLEVANTEINFDDVNVYLNSMVKILGYLLKAPNSTNINSGVGYYFSKGKFWVRNFQFRFRINTSLAGRILAA